MEVLIAVLIVLLVAAWVSVPLRRAAGTGDERLEDPVMAE
ncbi:MAG: hypothetical protein QOE75_2808, partial [Solirubrobacterales bacterium]|nr:hypothetical protein [Solirubrobacterales bacterium]